MPDCKLILSCPFFNDEAQGTNGLSALYKESYCHGFYDWCGRYRAFRALARELKKIKKSVAMVNRSNGDGEK